MNKKQNIDIWNILAWIGYSYCFSVIFLYIIVGISNGIVTKTLIISSIKRAKIVFMVSFIVGTILLMISSVKLLLSNDLYEKRRHKIKVVLSCAIIVIFATVFCVACFV